MSPFTRSHAAEALRTLHNHLDALDITYEYPGVASFKTLHEYLHHARMPERMTITDESRAGFIKDGFDSIEMYREAGGHVNEIIEACNFLICVLAGYV